MEINLKHIILIGIAVFVIICFVVMGNKKDGSYSEGGSGNAEQAQLNYNEVVDEETGEKYYQVYDRNTGKVTANITDESALQMYIDNPDFVGSEQEEEKDSSIEEDENIISGSVWGDNDSTEVTEEQL